MSNNFRDRIRELRRVKCSELRANPKNWRTHPLPQREAVRAMLAEVGFADALLARETPDGLVLIDGHLRAEESGNQIVPVLILDVTEAEADKILLLLDPLAAMAAADEEKQRELLAAIEAEEAGLRKLLAEMEQVLGEAEGDDKEPAVQYEGPPEMSLRPHEHYDYVMVLASNTHQWNRLVELLDLTKIKRTMGRTGIARGVPADRLIALLEGKEARRGDAKDRRSE